jgi:hypothetical protein
MWIAALAAVFLKSGRGGVVIANAVVWGALMVGTSLILKGTGAFAQIQLVLGGGAAATLLMLGVSGQRSR